MALRQNKFRFYANDGAEGTSTPLAAINVSISRDKNDQSTFLIRFLIQSDASTAGTNTAPQFQRNVNAGAFGNITTTSTIVKAVTTTVFTDAQNTTALLGGTGTFESSSQGCTHDGLAGGAQMDIVANGNAETVCAVQLVSADIAIGDVIGLRISTSPTAITAYDQNATVTITGAVTATLDIGEVDLTGADLAASSQVTTDNGSIVATGADVTPVLTFIQAIDSGTIVTSGQDLAAPAQPVLDTGSVIATGTDVPALSQVSADAGTIVLAGADIAQVVSFIQAIDSGSALVTGTDVLAALLLPIDSGTAQALGADTSANTSVASDTASLAVTGADLTPVEQGAVLLATGVVALSGSDLLASESRALDICVSIVTGAELVPTLVVALDEGAITLVGEDVGGAGEVKLVLDIGSIVVSGLLVWPQPELFWQRFDAVPFSAPSQTFVVGFGSGRNFLVAA